MDVTPLCRGREFQTVGSHLRMRMEPVLVDGGIRVWQCPVCERFYLEWLE